MAETALKLHILRFFSIFTDFGQYFFKKGLSDFEENYILGQFGHADFESGLSLANRALGGAREQK